MRSKDRLWIIKRELLYNHFLTKEEYNLSTAALQIDVLLAQEYDIPQVKITQIFQTLILEDELINNTKLLHQIAKDDKASYKTILIALIDQKLRYIYNRLEGIHNINQDGVPS